MKNLLGVPVVILVLAGCADAQLRGDEPSPRTVTGQGSVELKRQADILRVEVEVLAKGKDIKEALQKLRQRRQAAQRQLEVLGVPANAIEFGKPMIVPEKDERQQQFAAMMMMRRMNNAGNKPPQKPKEPPQIVVACTLKAEVRLTQADPDELLIAAHTLEGQMKAADLGGLKDLKQTAAQDEEMNEERQAMMMGMNENEAPKRGEPLFLYVSKISADDRAKALAQAFSRAKLEAGHLARAAGVELGPLHHLEDNSGVNAGQDDEAIMMNMNPYAYRSRMAERDRQADVAMGSHPGRISYRISVSASFELRPPLELKRPGGP